MTNQKIDKIMAEKVMGWHESGDGEWLDVAANHAAWSNIASAVIYDPCNEVWTPSTNIAHAFQADDKMAGKGFFLELQRDFHEESFPYTAQYQNRFTDRWAKFKEHDNPATAICLAIIAVLKGGFLK